MKFDAFRAQQGHRFAQQGVIGTFAVQDQ